MILTVSGSNPAAAHGLRPMDPARDLGSVADLIAEAFANEIDDRGRAALREMRWMARLSPLVWWWAQADPAFSDAFGGFVWEVPAPPSRRSQIVGNVSLNRAPGCRHTWVICNVVVSQEHRGRGIARQLMEAALVEAQALSAREIVLQVHKDNLRALRLYTSLGFTEMGGEMDLRLPVPEPVDLSRAPAGYEIRGWLPSDGQAAYDLARHAIPSYQQWLRPVRADRYRLSWWQRAGSYVNHFVTGRRDHRLVATKDQNLVAMTTMAAVPRADHCVLELLVHPEHRDQVEQALISRALFAVSGAPARAVRTRVDQQDAAAVGELRAQGFVEGRTLLTLGRKPA